MMLLLNTYPRFADRNLTSNSSEAINDNPILEPKSKIFLSHSGVEKDFVSHLCKALEEHCPYPFFDGVPKSLLEGENFLGLISKLVQQCKLFVVVISEDYFMTKRPMIELNAFVEAKKEGQSSMNLGIFPLVCGLSLSELKNEKKRQRWFDKWETFAREDPKGWINVDDWKYALDLLTKFNGLPYGLEWKQVEGYENEIMSHICKILTSNIKWEDLHVRGNSHEVGIGKMKHMAIEISPLSLLRDLMIEFARLSDSTLLTYPDGDPNLVKIEDEDLQSLQTKRHLSISIIDFYIKYLEKNVLSIKDKDHFFFFDCSFFIRTFGTETSTNIDYEQAWQWIPGVNLFAKDYIFIPIYKNEHWSLIIIYHLNNLTTLPTEVHYRSPCIFHLYSVEEEHDDLEGYIRSFIFYLWIQIHQNSDILQALFHMKYVEAKVPQEDNGHDSGIYLLYYMERFTLESASLDHYDFSIDKSTTVMAERSSWLSLGRDAPPLSPSILVVEGDMPSTSVGKGPSSLPEVPKTDLILYCMDKLHSYLDIAHECSVRVQEMPSRKFNNEQCGYLDAKLKVILQSATFFLVTAEFSTSKDMTRCIEGFKLLLASALKIESFIQRCCKNEWLQAAMTLTNTTEYVSSLGFNLELCRVYFCPGWRATRALTAAEVDIIDREEVEIVKRKACVDVDVLLDKVILDLPSLQAQDKDLAIYLLQRLKRVKPVSTSLSPESPFWSAFNDRGFLGRIFQMVRQTEQLGKGASATVHKAMWLGTPVAKKTFYGPEHPDYLQEAQILARLCHPNIISMFCCAMDKRKCSIVMELMDEDLHSFMQRRLDADPHFPPFSVFEAVDVILQIGEGVNYLHQNGILHRDLKSLNILVKNILPPDLEVQYVLIKVADFGFAKIKESSTRYSNQTFNIGTNRWMPPEVIKFHNSDGQPSTCMLEAGPKYPKKSDVYSFGMVCFEILTGDVPFPQETSSTNIKKKVLKGGRPTLPEYCPSKLKTLIEECWDPKPTNRPSFASICSSLKHLKCLLMSV